MAIDPALTKARLDILYKVGAGTLAPELAGESSRGCFKPLSALPIEKQKETMETIVDLPVPAKNNKWEYLKVKVSEMTLSQVRQAITPEGIIRSKDAIKAIILSKPAPTQKDEWTALRVGRQPAIKIEKAGLIIDRDKWVEMSKVFTESE